MSLVIFVILDRCPRSERRRVVDDFVDDVRDDARPNGRTPSLASDSHAPFSAQTDVYHTIHSCCHMYFTSPYAPNHGRYLSCSPALILCAPTFLIDSKYFSTVALQFSKWFTPSSR